MPELFPGLVELINWLTESGLKTVPQLIGVMDLRIRADKNLMADERVLCCGLNGKLGERQMFGFPITTELCLIGYFIGQCWIVVLHDYLNLNSDVAAKRGVTHLMEQLIEQLYGFVSSLPDQLLVNWELCQFKEFIVEPLFDVCGPRLYPTNR